MGGSWVYDALHDMPDANKAILLFEFISSVGQDVLDETISYLSSQQDPMPSWLVDRLA